MFKESNQRADGQQDRELDEKIKEIKEANASLELKSKEYEDIQKSLEALKANATQEKEAFDTKLNDLENKKTAYDDAEQQLEDIREKLNDAKTSQNESELKSFKEKEATQKERLKVISEDLEEIKSEVASKRNLYERAEKDKQQTDNKRSIIEEQREKERERLQKLEAQKDTIAVRREKVRVEEKQQYETPVGLYWMVGGVLLLFAVIFIVGIILPLKFGDELSSGNYARGLITFTVANGTLIIALILVLITLLGARQDSSERFSNAKEIFALLVGILGTIVGYYFGQVSSGDLTSPNNNPPAVESGSAPSTDVPRVQ